jgi:hypothetical protein
MYSYTGIQGLDGGYAYPPGSYMTQFMDQINNTMANASMMPSTSSGMGSSSMMGSGMPQQQGDSSGMMVQLMGLMIGMMLKKMLPALQQRMQANQAASVDNESTSLSVQTSTTGNDSTQSSDSMPVTRQQEAADNAE